MWVDRRKKRTVAFKVDDYEMQIIQDIMKANNVSMGEAIRRALWVFRVLYADDLTVRDALYDSFDPDDSLHKALKPIPELSHFLGLEFKLWKKQKDEEHANSVNKGF
jgi:hypothetical protein